MNFKDLPDKDSAIDLLKHISLQKLAVKPEKISQPLALYGAGDLGQMAKKYFDHIGFRVECIIDLHADKWRRKSCWKGTKILFPDEVSTEQKNNYLLVVCIVKIPYIPLAEELLNQGWKNNIPFYDVAEAYREHHPLSNGWFAKKFDSVDIRSINSVLDLWSDDISRAHHLQFIAWRLLRQEWVFDKAPVETENRFFIPEILKKITDNESFVDVGAHHGKVTENFIKLIDSNFNIIWMIEPDSENLSKLTCLLDSLDQRSRRKVSIFSNVIGRQKESSYFYEGLGYASQLSELGKTKVNVTTIDDMNLSPTFIKLHLEGGELAALKGSKRTMTTYRPIIAITSYHNDEGIWKLPKWLMDNLNNYQFYMRLHSWCGTGAVVYGIPIN
jgi:FkbM family methyltransferase